MRVVLSVLVEVGAVFLLSLVSAVGRGRITQSTPGRNYMSVLAGRGDPRHVIFPYLILTVSVSSCQLSIATAKSGIAVF